MVRPDAPSANVPPQVLPPALVQLRLVEPPVVVTVPSPATLTMRLPAGLGAAAPFTFTAKAGRVAVALPSLTVMTMFEYRPTCAAVGVPVRLPFTVLNV